MSKAEQIKKKSARKYTMSHLLQNNKKDANHFTQFKLMERHFFFFYKKKKNKNFYRLSLKKVKQIMTWK